ncbi:MAG: hypothetical protein OXC99_05245, partial [Chloroflexi bacterium]|nr:hypothetical protein [Chloroflexota bacterium]
MGQIFRVEFVHRLDDGLKESAGGVVLGLFGDGDDADAPAPQHGLEGDGVFPFAGESREFPDEDLLEGGLGPGGLVKHPLELWPVGDASALGLVHVFAGDEVAVVLGVVPERPELCGDGEVHVLAVAGDPGIEGRGRQVESVSHRSVLLVSSSSDWRGGGPFKPPPPLHSPPPLHHRAGRP